MEGKIKVSICDNLVTTTFGVGVANANASNIVSPSSSGRLRNQTQTAVHGEKTRRLSECTVCVVERRLDLLLWLAGFWF